MLSRFQNLVTAKTGIALAAAFGLAVSATSVHADAFADRSAAMKEVGAAMEAMGKMMADPSTFDGETVEAKAGIIATNLTKAKDLFPAGDVPEKSRAKETIWSDNEGFMKIMDGAIAAAKATAEAGGEFDQDGFAASFSSLGKGCKGCHEGYRTPKKQ